MTTILQPIKARGLREAELVQDIDEAPLKSGGHTFTSSASLYCNAVHRLHERNFVKAVYTALRYKCSLLWLLQQKQKTKNKPKKKTQRQSAGIRKRPGYSSQVLCEILCRGNFSSAYPSVILNEIWPARLD